ncbi:bacillithiol biosynthesis cysteine-adding enzyme BshC [Flavihumibacter fluvii]|uniref:bacillithiol biosynthesis cysteine-adding enzyme BshC n=1 Tax=Flavihumibacter fluvii TaxID=2838157 RepID=UPI001BDE238E|nr:bacillithiol biosynthesis cysteine-adding enzyme BshC [Flavihumibacter fluvii]ULQ54345.1 bacillithiol biosynthesis cysteine-adding enzyme BshC [Flavihumibacter fluvii]
MECTSTLINYQQTGFFSDIVSAFLQGDPDLKPFYEHPVSKEGLFAAIQAREAYPTNRKLLVSALEAQYAKLPADQAGNPGAKLVAANISLLQQDTTFTVCTAHQPNIFTGYLYFVYKILHAVKLSDYLKREYPQYNFVPVYYMGSEDADLDELGKIFLNGEKLVWNTPQTGAVGRMKTKGLDQLISRIEGELSILPFGPELMGLLKKAYGSGNDIQTATFILLHDLFARFGLVVLIADQADLKREMTRVFEDDLFLNTPSAIVTATIERLSAKFKVQANPRDINLFYLKDAIRNRFERKGDDYVVVDTDLRFTADELKKELADFPDRFSPNVILRGLYQETILPNIAFIGGGGELAYWLELKDLFQHYKVPYPVQVLRNSLLLAEEKWMKKINALGFGIDTFFLPHTDILNELVRRDSATQVHLTNEIRDAHAFYVHLENISAQVDKTLVTHVKALEKKMVKQLQELEKKLLRGEKRKFSDQSRQISAIKAALFPNNNLQERVENFMPFYAKYGRDFLQGVYDCSPILEQQFLVAAISAETVSAKNRDVEKSLPQ